MCLSLSCRDNNLFAVYPLAPVGNVFCNGPGAGFCQGGGVGLCMAEWMMDGEPSIDVWAMDVARFGDYATPDYGTIKSSENYERRFILTFPNETLPKGRRQKTTRYQPAFGPRARTGFELASVARAGAQRRIVGFRTAA